MASKGKFTLEKALEILNLTEDASKEDVRRAYKNLAKRYHPDKNSDANAKEKFQEVSEAYRTVVHSGFFLHENDGIYYSSDEDDFYNYDDDDDDDDFYMFFHVLQSTIFRQRFYEFGRSPEENEVSEKKRSNLYSLSDIFLESGYSARYQQRSSVVTDKEDAELYEILRKKQTTEDEEDLDPDEVVKKYKSYEEWNEAKKSKKKSKFTLPPFPRPLSKKQQQKKQYMRDKQIQEIHEDLMKTKAAHEEKERTRHVKNIIKGEERGFEAIANLLNPVPEDRKPSKTEKFKSTNPDQKISDDGNLEEERNVEIKKLSEEEIRYEQTLQNFRQKERERNLSEHRQIIAGQVQDKKMKHQQLQREQELKRLKQQQEPPKSPGKSCYYKLQQNKPGQIQSQQADHNRTRDNRSQQQQTQKSQPCGWKNQKVNSKMSGYTSGSQPSCAEKKKNTEAIPLPPPENAWFKGSRDIRGAARPAENDGHLIPSSFDEEEKMLQRAIELSIKEEEEKQRCLLYFFEQEKSAKSRSQSQTQPFNFIKQSESTRVAHYDNESRVVSFKDSSETEESVSSELSQSNESDNKQHTSVDQNANQLGWEKYGVRPKSDMYKRQVPETSEKIVRSKTSKQNVHLWDVNRVENESDRERLFDKKNNSDLGGEKLTTSVEKFFQNAVVDESAISFSQRSFNSEMENSDNSQGVFPSCDKANQKEISSPESKSDTSPIHGERINSSLPKISTTSTTETVPVPVETTPLLFGNIGAGTKNLFPSEGNLEDTIETSTQDIKTPADFNVCCPPIDANLTQAPHPFSILPPFLGPMAASIPPNLNPMFMPGPYLPPYLVCPPVLPTAMPMNYFGLNPMFSPIMGMTGFPTPYSTVSMPVDEGAVPSVLPVVSEAGNLDNKNKNESIENVYEKKSHLENEIDNSQKLESTNLTESLRVAERRDMLEEEKIEDIKSSQGKFSEEKIEDVKSCQGNFSEENTHRQARSKVWSKPRGCQNPSARYSQKGTRQPDVNLNKTVSQNIYDGEDTHARRTRNTFKF